MFLLVVRYLAVLVPFLGADFVWLSVMAPKYYKPVLGDIALEGFRAVPAAAFYLIYPLGLLFFAVNPALRNGSVLTALLNGALFGFFSYATYDLTNQATLRNWTWALTLTDVAWGTALGALSAAVAYLVCSRLPAA